MKRIGLAPSSTLRDEPSGSDSNESKSRGFTLIELPVVRKRGFTLIELLVVIAIIGILATVILVNLTGGRKAAQATAVLSYLKSVQTTAITCTDDGRLVSEPTNASTGGGNICSTTDALGDWSTLANYPNWKYLKAGATDKPTAMGATSFTATTSGFTYGAYKIDQPTTGGVNPNWFITCTLRSCNKQGF